MLLIQNYTYLAVHNQHKYSMFIKTKYKNKVEVKKTDTDITY